MLVKLYLSFFSLSRAIKLAKRISPSLFASITDPMSDVQKFSEVRDWLRGLIRKLANRYLYQALSRPLYQGISWEPTWKALPTDRKRPGQSRRERGIFANFTSQWLWFAMLRLSMSVNPALALGMTQKLTSKGSAAFFMVIHYHLVMNGMIGYPIYQPIVMLQFHLVFLWSLTVLVTYFAILAGSRIQLSLVRARGGCLP